MDDLLMNTNYIIIGDSITYGIGDFVMFYFIYSTVIGKMYIEETDGFITRLSLIDDTDSFSKDNLCETSLIRKTYIEVCEYLEGIRTCFDIPISPNGTDFQKKVWNCLQRIPYGHTKSYQDIAVEIGNVKACRAIGMANYHNPILIIIPCHRVIGKNGKLIGFGCGLDVKEYLLNLEKVDKK